MKKIKDRPMTELLAKQLRIQKERLHVVGTDAYITFNRKHAYTLGTIYSDRLIPKSEVL